MRNRFFSGWRKKWGAFFSRSGRPRESGTDHLPGRSRDPIIFWRVRNMSREGCAASVGCGNANALSAIKVKRPCVATKKIVGFVISQWIVRLLFSIFSTKIKFTIRWAGGWKPGVHFSIFSTKFKFTIRWAWGVWKPGFIL